MTDAYVNVSMSVSGDTSIQRGSNVTLKVRVSNTAPNAAMSVNGTFIQLILPTSVIPVSWTAVYAQGASGPTSGTGLLATEITTLPASGYVTFTVVLNVYSTAALGSYTVKSLVSVPPTYTNLGVSKDTTYFDVQLPKATVTLGVTSINSMERGRRQTFVFTAANTSSVPVRDAVLRQILPEGFFPHSFSYAVTGGATASTVDSYNVALTLPANSSVVVTSTVFVSPNTCLGSYTTKGSLMLRGVVAAADDGSCVKGSKTVQVINVQAMECVPLCGSFDQIACSDGSSVNGYVLINLVSKGKPYDPVTQKFYANKEYNIPLTSSSWQSLPLPVNAQIVTKEGDTTKAIESYYLVSEYLVNGSGATYLHAQYKVVLNADDDYGSCLQVGLGCEV